MRWLIVLVTCAALGGCELLTSVTLDSGIDATAADASPGLDGAAE